MVFTGLVQAVGWASWDPKTNIVSVRVPGPKFWSRALKGDSIAVNGVCLTLLEESDSDTGTFFVMEETRRKTNLSDLGNVEYQVNLEHAMRHGDSLGGHTVSGHVDGVGRVARIEPRPDGSRDVWVDLSGFSAEDTFVVFKGSITLDGVSLTVAEWRSPLLRVSLIPHTLAHTNLQNRQAGDRINIEFDQALKLAATRQQEQEQASKNAAKRAPQNEWEQRLLDLDYMAQAVALGEKGRLTAPPNPWVAAVIVDDETGRVVGSGFHDKAGRPHAEVNAINDAIHSGYTDFTKSTIYVTLEPCHHHGRTPPCDQLLIQKKFRRCVVALQDPDYRVSGQGIAALRAAGIQVDSGIGAQEAAASLRPYLHHRKTKRPLVVAKVALSIDGKIGCADQTSQWITGASARDDAQRLRAASQAILVGSETAIKDNPRLNVRQPSLAHLDLKPLRVLLDSRGRVTSGAILDASFGPSLVFTTEKCDPKTRDAWSKIPGLEVVQADAIDGHVSLEFVLEELGKRGILQLLVEGGSKVHSGLLSRNLVDEIVLYTGSCLIGGSGLAWPVSPLAKTMSEVKSWTLKDVKQVGNDVRITYAAPAADATASAAPQ